MGVWIACTYRDSFWPDMRFFGNLVHLVFFLFSLSQLMCVSVLRCVLGTMDELM